MLLANARGQLNALRIAICKPDGSFAFSFHLLVILGLFARVADKICILVSKATEYTDV